MANGQSSVGKPRESARSDSNLDLDSSSAFPAMLDNQSSE